MRLSRALLLLVLLASAAPILLLGWMLVEARGGVDAAAAAAVLACLALAAVAAGLLARSVTRPIAECVRGALEIARGRFGRQVSVRAGNEIGDLAYTFNHMSRELASYDAENRRLIEALGQGYLDTIRSLASAIDAKDPYTHGHSQHVADLAVEIGREMGLAPEVIQALEYGGVLHDIGKIGMPDAILAKVTPLTADERDLARTHPGVGSEIVSGVKFLAAAAPAIRSHHERWDGKGYPEGLAGEDIPLVARIVNAADTWDACTSNRPYQKAFTAEEALAIMAGLRGTQLDPAVHDALVSVIRRRQSAQPAPGVNSVASMARLRQDCARATLDRNIGRAEAEEDGACAQGSGPVAGGPARRRSPGADPSVHDHDPDEEEKP
jgi:HD-GYP domain-containing protein (c-di-GMP phosphodiesterase class II)